MARSFVNKASKKIASLAGGDDLVDYLGSKIARQKPTTSKKAAALSAGKVALTMSSIAGIGALGKAASAANKGIRYIKIPGQKKPIKLILKKKGKQVINPTWPEKGGW